uniref:Ig-like domain-containing protein n=1 Tax=Coturnix japonica TaxID=93934 RepID=A0A8C2UBM5_COTJA
KPRICALWLLGNVLLPECVIPGSCCCPSSGVCAQFRLEASGGGVRAAGDSVQLSCQGSGFNLRDYSIRWYRQAFSGRLKWLSFIDISSHIHRLSPDIQGRASVSRDNSRSVCSLSLHSLRPQDSAHYFCAVHTRTGNPQQKVMEYWWKFNIHCHNANILRCPCMPM